MRRLLKSFLWLIVYYLHAEAFVLPRHPGVTSTGAKLQHQAWKRWLASTSGSGSSFDFDREPRRTKPSEAFARWDTNKAIGEKIKREADAGALLALVDRLEASSDHNCALALLRLGELTRNDRVQRDMVVNDGRFQKLLQLTIDLLPAARSIDVALTLSALEKLRYRPSEAQSAALLATLVSKPSALEGRSTAFVLTALAHLHIQPTVDFVEVLMEETQSSMGNMEPWVLSATVRGLASFHRELRPGPEYMKALFQEIESQLGAFTTKDLERLLYGLTMLFPPPRHGPPPPSPMGLGPVLLSRLQRVFHSKLPQFSDSSIVPAIRALARLPGVDKSAAMWDPIRDEVEARLPNLTLDELNEVCFAFSRVDYAPGPSFLHACITQCLLPRARKEMPNHVLTVIMALHKHRMTPEDAALVVHAVLPALEGRLQLLNPHRLSWLVCTLFRFNAVPPASVLSEALSCLGSKLRFIRPAFYSGVLHSLLVMHVPIPPALPAAIHTALRQPNLCLSPHDVTNLLNTALRTFQRFNGLPDMRTSISGLLDHLLSARLPSLLSSDLAPHSVSSLLNSIMRLSRSDLPCLTFPPATVERLAHLAEAHLRAGELQGENLVLTLHALVRLGYFQHPSRSDLLTSLLTAVGCALPSMDRSSTAALTSALSFLASAPGMGPLVQPLHAPLAAALARHARSYTPAQLARVFNSYSLLGSCGPGDPVTATVSVLLATGASHNWPLRSANTILRAFERMRYDPGQRFFEQLQAAVAQRLREGKLDMRGGRISDAKLHMFTSVVASLGYVPRKDLLVAKHKGLRRKDTHEGLSMERPPEEHDEEGSEDEEEEEEEDWHLATEGVMMVGSGGARMGPSYWGELGGESARGEEQEQPPTKRDEKKTFVVRELPAVSPDKTVST